MASNDDLPTGDAYERQWESLAGWFLGPRAENRQIFNELMLKSLNWHEDRREDFFPADPSYFTAEIRNSEAAQGEYKDLENKLKKMHTALNKSIPFFSTRYQGHMTWDNTMPSILGYVSGLLWNQNNVDSTASPVTTQFEVEVGKQLCSLMRFPTDVNDPWGHITGCGSVANLEAMWAARNAKLHPLALRNTVVATTSLTAGASYIVKLPKEDTDPKPLNECTTWELLNLPIDDLCNITDNVIDHIFTTDPQGRTKEEIKGEFDTALEKESCVQIGLPEFYSRHQIGSKEIFNEANESEGKNYPRVFSPGTNHYSWPKGATVLGLGDKNVIPINVDARARQDTELLRNQLQKAVDNEIPVLMAVAVIGSTEESSVDDVDTILKMRDEFALKGLTFSVHADAAWGGYLNCMTHGDPDKYVTTADTKAHDYVPTIPLSDFVDTQYRKLGEVDTVTIDPHKAGFCPYPAGALLYRNGTMKGFITLAAPEVFHSPNDLNVGVYGLEGSKPGAAACGVLLSHEVIGLDANGYGRILGQCQFGSKLFYCMWETVARKGDPFMCMNLIAPMLSELEDAGFTFPDLAAVHKFIEDKILGKQNEVIHKNLNKELDFLKVVGPDALINQFTVNCVDKDGKGQKSIDLVNELNNTIFNELTSSVGQDTKRVKMFLTTSKLADKNYGRALDQLKERLDLDPNDKSDLAFLRNTCMEPYQASELYVTRLGDLFRNTVLSCIGALGETYLDSDGKPYGDPNAQHTFLVVSDKMKPYDAVDKDGNPKVDHRVFLEYVPKDNSREYRYQTVFRANIEDKVAFAQHLAAAKAAGKPLYVRSSKATNLFQFIKDEPTNTRDVDVILGNEQLGTIRFTVDEVWEYRHFELEAEYNEHQRYFMYGDAEDIYMSHIMTGKMDDFHQVVQLKSYPQDVPPELINLGLTVQIDELSGTPLKDAQGKIVDPLQNAIYTGHYRGKQYSESITRLEIGNRVFQEVNDVSNTTGDASSGGHGHGHGHGKGKGKKH